MPLHEADAVFQSLDEAQRRGREQPGYTGSWYDKTRFRIDFTMQGQPDSYEGRQDFGDGDGSLIQHIRATTNDYAQDESWKTMCCTMRAGGMGGGQGPAGNASP